LPHAQISGGSFQTYKSMMEGDGRLFLFRLLSSQVSIAKLFLCAGIRKDKFPAKAQRRKEEKTQRVECLFILNAFLCAFAPLREILSSLLLT
jgi:hypothetical protein